MAERTDLMSLQIRQEENTRMCYSSKNLKGISKHLLTLLSNLVESQAQIERMTP